jgi:hypothetical protein
MQHARMAGAHPSRREIMIGLLNHTAKGQEAMPALPFWLRKHGQRPSRQVVARPLLKLEQLRIFSPKRRHVFAAVGEIVTLPAGEQGRSEKDLGPSLAAWTREIGAAAPERRIPPDEQHAFPTPGCRANANRCSTVCQSGIAEFSDVDLAGCLDEAPFALHSNTQILSLTFRTLHLLRLQLFDACRDRWKGQKIIRSTI